MSNVLSIHEHFELILGNFKRQTTTVEIKKYIPKMPTDKYSRAIDICTSQNQFIHLWVFVG